MLPSNIKKILFKNNTFRVSLIKKLIKGFTQLAMRIETIKSGKNNFVGKIFTKINYVYIKNILKIKRLVFITLGIKVRLYF